MFLTINKDGYQEYTREEFYETFDLREMYLHNLYNEDTKEISDLSVDFFANWYGFDPYEVLKQPLSKRHIALRDYSSDDLLSAAADIIRDGYCEEYSCGCEAMTYANILYLYSKRYKFKKEIRVIDGFDIQPEYTSGLFKDLEKQTDFEIFVRS